MSESTHATSSPSEPLTDSLSPREVVGSETVFDGYIFDIRRDRVKLNDAAEPVSRDYMSHPGAVAIAALNERDEILLINQHRHPTGMNMWEIPAGLLDQEGEPPLEAAQRELLEETDLRADTWHTLLEFDNSPGCSTEANRVYLARGISEVPESERHEREDEEAEIRMRWVPLNEAVEAVLASRLHSPSANLAILACWASVQRDFTDARDPRAPWPAHPTFRDHDASGPASSNQRSSGQGTGE